jgi:hypothetical protein
MWMLPVFSLALAPTPGLPEDRLVLGLHPPERLVVLDVATGAVKQRRLPGGTLCRGPLMSYGGRPLAARDDELYLRSARFGAFWALRVRLGSSRALAVREITGAGHTLFRAPRRPPPGYPTGAVPAGIVFERGGRRRIWNPRTGALRSARGDRLVAASERGGRFSPDGSVLAVAQSAARARVVLLNTRTGSRERLPVWAGDRGALAWSPSGEWLYVAAPERRIVAYSLRTRRTLTMPVSLGGEIIDLAAAG